MANNCRDELAALRAELAAERVRCAELEGLLRVALRFVDTEHYDCPIDLYDRIEAALAGKDGAK